MARAITLTTTTASVSASATLVIQLTVSSGASLLNILKVKVVPSAGTGSSTLEIFKAYNGGAPSSTTRVAVWKNFIGSLYEPSDMYTGTAAEALEGRPIPYEDTDAGGKITMKFTNNDSVSKTYAVTVLIEEVPKFDSSRVMTAYKAELLGGFLYFVGRTSSQPGLRANGATLESRLADDSGYCNFTAAQIMAASDIIYFGGSAVTNALLKRTSTTIKVRKGDDSADADLTCGSLTVSGTANLGGASATFTNSVVCVNGVVTGGT